MPNIVILVQNLDGGHNFKPQNSQSEICYRLANKEEFVFHDDWSRDWSKRPSERLQSWLLQFISWKSEGAFYNLPELTGYTLQNGAHNQCSYVPFGKNVYGDKPFKLAHRLHFTSDMQTGR